MMRAIPMASLRSFLVDLHFEHGLGMARVDADHRQTKSLKLGP
jgi:hypothetical protein